MRALSPSQTALLPASIHVLAYGALFGDEGLSTEGEALSDLGPLGQEIERALQEPLIVDAKGSAHNRAEFTASDDQTIKHLTDTHLTKGRVRLPRLTAIHRLLCGPKGPEGSFAIENGAGCLVHTTAALWMMGTRVLVKEIDRPSVTIFERGVERLFPQALSSDEKGLRYAIGYPRINQHDRADIAYWVNPEPGMFLYRDMTRIADYMGRDVVAGGFLVIQSDILRHKNFQPNPRMWEEVYFRVIDGLVFPTTIWDMDAALIVLRRLGR